MIIYGDTIKYYTEDGRLHGLQGKLPDGSFGIRIAPTEVVVPTMDIIVKHRKLTQGELNRWLGL